jgi:hypothetical protein
VKIPLFLAAATMTVFSSFAGITLEDISPHFSTNTEIIWDVPTNALPKGFRVYKRLPRVFSATTISNAVVLASFQSKGFPTPSTNQIVIWADSTAGEGVADLGNSNLTVQLITPVLSSEVTRLLRKQFANPE